MRRLFFALIVLVGGALWFGAAQPTPALTVNGVHLTHQEYVAELSTLHKVSNVACFFSPLAGASLQAGVGYDSMNSNAAAAWMNLRVEGIALEHYVTTTLKYHATARRLATAKTSLEAELSAAATADGLDCPGTSSAAIAAMPAGMRNAMIDSQAASLYLISKLNSTIALTPKSIAAYYAAHRSNYTTLCIAVAVVDPHRAAAFIRDAKHGVALSALAKKYSIDPSAKKGGAYGCYAAGSTNYATVSAYTKGIAMGHFNLKDSVISYGTSQEDLFVGPTAYHRLTLSQAKTKVEADITASNASAANQVKSSVLYAAAVSIDPAFGRWGLASSGPQVFAVALPSDGGNAVTTQLTTTSTSSAANS